MKRLTFLICIFVLFSTEYSFSFSNPETHRLTESVTRRLMPTVAHEEIGYNKDTTNNAIHQITGNLHSTAATDVSSIISNRDRAQVQNACCIADQPTTQQNTRELNIIGQLSDCSCKLENTAVNSNISQEAQQLFEICKCYGAQKGGGGLTFVDAYKDAMNKFVTTSNISNLVSTSNTLGYLQRGPQLQVALMGTSPELMNLRNVYKAQDLQQDNKEAVEGITNNNPLTDIGSSNYDEKYLKAIRGAKPDFNTFGMSVIDPAGQDENCLLMKDYLTMKQVDFTDSFYKDLQNLNVDSITTDPNDPVLKDWDVMSLKKRITALYDQGKTILDQEVLILQDRMKFLMANPLYGSLLSTGNSSPEALTRKKELLTNIKKNFAVSGCPSLIKNCMTKNLSKIHSEDAKFFSQPDVQILVNKTTNDISNLYVKDPILTLDQTSLQPEVINSFSGRMKVVDLRNTKPDDFITGSSFESSAAKECARITPFVMFDELKNASVGSLKFASFFQDQMADLNPDPKLNSTYKKMNERICSQKRCVDTKSVLTFVTATSCKSETLAEAYAGKKCSPGLDGQSCRINQIKNYLRSHVIPVANLEILNSDNFDASFVADYLDQYAENNKPEAQDPAAVSQQMAIVPQTSADQEIRYFRNGERISSSESRVVELKQQNLISRAEASLPQGTSPQAAVAATAVPQVQPQETTQAIAAPVTAATSLMPVAASVPMIERDLQSSRQETIAANAQADALASRIPQASSSDDRKKLEDQIMTLTARANAADARSRELEAKLSSFTSKPVVDRSPASVGTPAPVVADSSSSRSRVSASPSGFSGSNFAAPVSVPSSGGQIFNLGSGSSTVQAASVAPLGKTSGGVNLNFKYNQSDAKTLSNGNSGAGLIVAGASSSFEATSELASAVNNSPAVDIGNVSPDVLSLLDQKDPQTIAQYADQTRATTGNLVRLTFGVSGSTEKRELIVGKSADGTLFFPAVRNLAVRRLQQLNAALGSGQ